MKQWIKKFEEYEVELYNLGDEPPIDLSLISYKEKIRRKKERKFKKKFEDPEVIRAMKNRKEIAEISRKHEAAKGSKSELL